MKNKRLSILLVEDHGPLAENIVRYMQLKNMDVRSVADGKEGLYEAITGQYDCVILDIGLPGLDGLEVAERLRQEGKDVPVLMLTSRGRSEDVVTGLDHGADDYLAKPFDYRELLARIESLVRRSHKRVSLNVTAGALSIDDDAREVTWRGQRISFSTREYELLSYLARRADHYVSREELAREVWGERDDFSASKTIDVHVGYLRKKLGADAILTKKGVGYCFPTRSEGE